jgi:hypothetical protein
MEQVRTGLVVTAALALVLAPVAAEAQGDKRPAPAGAAPPAAAAPAASGAAAEWVAGAGGAIPSGAVAVGYDAGGFLYSCRGAVEGGTHPGKVRPGIAGCFVPLGGRETTLGSYEVLRGSGFTWVVARDGTIPEGAIEAGRTRTNQPLYVCRAAAHDGRSVMLVPGKIGAGLRGCNVGYGEREVTQAFYEVLVRS